MESNLKYITLGNTSPQGKAKVYFCCHREDSARFLESISAEILRAVPGAAVWYQDPLREAAPDLLADLAEMQLFVVPVTRRFLLQDTPARSVELAFAIQQHIPVLPIMKEEGLLRIFQKVCGDLQFLEESSQGYDPTALPYGEKRDRFLKNVLLEERLTSAIRSAFSGYIFLSYRKKDREHAQRLMRLIHRYDCCRDTAIWYDEFLTPGEDFNQEIEDALKKSGMMVMVVTPNLLEDPNYVQDTEYPSSVRLGKQILPIEAAPTDRISLEKRYPGLGNCVSTEEETALYDILRAKFQIKTQDPGHLYLIGLAYLAGIDVEKDYQKALGMITRAAKEGVPEAYEKIVFMYRNGEGVARNLREAARWQAEYVDLLEDALHTAPGEKDYEALLKQLWELGHLYEDLGQPETAIETFARMKGRAISYAVTFGFDKAARRVWLAQTEIGSIYLEQDRFKQAEEAILSAAHLAEKMAEGKTSAETRHDLSYSSRLMSELCLIQGKHEEARTWSLKAKEISEAVAEEAGGMWARMDLVHIYASLGDIAFSENKLEEARPWYRKCLDICETLAAQRNTPDSKREVLVYSVKLSLLAMSCQDYLEAGKLLDRAAVIADENVAKTGSVESHRDRSVILRKKGELCLALGQHEEGERYLLQALQIAAKLAEVTKMLRCRQDVWECCYILGEEKAGQGACPEAVEWYRKSIRDMEENADKQNGAPDFYHTLARTYRRAGDASLAGGNPGEAKEWYEGGLILITQIVRRTGAEQHYEEFAKLNYIIGTLPGQPAEEAREFLNRALKHYRAMAETYKKPQYQEMARLCEEKLR